MRHRVRVSKMNRHTAARKSLQRNLAVSLIEHGEITTTLPKAKFVRPFVERLLTLSKEDALASHRLVISRLGNKPAAAKKLKEVWAAKFMSTPGGYTRITLLGPRQTDRAEMAKIGFVVKEEKKKEKATPEKPEKTTKAESKTTKEVKG